MLRESIGMALQSFAANKLRSILSLIGVVIGVASVVAIASLSESGSGEMRRQFESFGLDSITVYRGWSDYAEAPAFNEDLYRDLRGSFPAIKAIIPVIPVPMQIISKGDSSGGQILAVDAPYFAGKQLQLDLGRGFDELDEYAARFVIVLGTELARELFPEGSPLGKSVLLNANELTVGCEVIGVLAKSESFMGDDTSRTAFVPAATVSKRLFGNLEAASIQVLAADKTAVVELGAALENYFISASGGPEAVWINTPQKWAEENEKMIGTLSLLVGGIAGISLLVGGIGIMNIMLVSVSERKKEIGLRKALGATEGAIQLQFLIEAIVLTTTGGLLGLGIGSGIGYIAVQLFEWTFASSAGPALLALVISGVVGIGAGLYPAARASRLDPVEALAAE